MSVPRGQSCTVSNCHVAKTMPLQLNCGVRDLFKTKFCRDIFNFFFLQGRKSKRAQITRTNCIFKPVYINHHFTMEFVAFLYLSTVPPQ